MAIERTLIMEKTPASVFIKKGAARAFKSGGLWIYDNEIERMEGNLKDGDMAKVFDFDGYQLGVASTIPVPKLRSV